jgi:hypothetical protein
MSLSMPKVCRTFTLMSGVACIVSAAVAVEAMWKCCSVLEGFGER